MLIRSFIAVPIPDEPADEIIKYIFRMRPNLNFKWVNRDQLHITLKFLGEIDTNKLQLVKNALDEIKINFEPFRINLNKLGSFPGVLFLSGDKGVKELNLLAKNINQKIFEYAQIQFDKRKFRPHVTLARFHNKNISPEELLTSLENLPNKNIEWTCNEIYLMKSDLKPSGAVYTRLY